MSARGCRDVAVLFDQPLLDVFPLDALDRRTVDVNRTVATILLKGKCATSHWVTRPVLTEFGAIPVEARFVTDDNVTTGAGVCAGLDFGIAVVEALRGKPYAASPMLQAEYHPEPPFVGGTLATTDPAVGAMMSEMFAPVADRFRAIAKAA